MSITDELREWAKEFWEFSYSKFGDKSNLIAIADRIDAEHEAVLEDARKYVYEGYVELPKDADGEYIHIGDVMEWVDIDGEVTVTCTVDAVGVGCFFAWDNANGRFAQKCASAYRHYHEPTVEDVLREMADRIYADEDEPRSRDAIVAEFAAKLRLAGDAE